MAFAEDLSMYDDLNGFAVAATYTPQGGAATPIRGVFDKDYAEPFDTESSGPVFTTRTANVPNAKQGDSLQIGAGSYKVRTPKPDGLGVTVLTLKLA